MHMFCIVLFCTIQHQHIDPFCADVTVTSRRYLEAKQSENWRRSMQNSTDSAT